MALTFVRLVAKSLVSRDPMLRFSLLKSLGSVLVPGYRFKWPQMDWWGDKAFNRYLATFGELDGMNTDRRWMIHQLLRIVDDVPGDTAECGVFEGAGSWLICQANRSAAVPGRNHHIFDSFAGLSDPSGIDGDYWTARALACGEEVVRKNLAEFSNVEYYKGWIPDRFPDVKDRTFSFVHIDVDLHDPTRDSIAFFYSRMSDGGIIVVDDYGFASCPGATTAVDEFLADKPEKMIGLPDGGGFLLKGRFTAAAACLEPVSSSSRIAA